MQWLFCISFFIRLHFYVYQMSFSLSFSRSLFPSSCFGCIWLEFRFKIYFLNSSVNQAKGSLFASLVSLIRTDIWRRGDWNMSFNLCIIYCLAYNQQIFRTSLRDFPAIWLIVWIKCWCFVCSVWMCVCVCQEGRIIIWL